MIPLMKWQKRKTHRDKKQISGCRDWGKGGIGSERSMSTRFPFRIMKSFWNWIVVTAARQYECT